MTIDNETYSERLLRMLDEEPNERNAVHLYGTAKGGFLRRKGILESQGIDPVEDQRMNEFLTTIRGIKSRFPNVETVEIDIFS